MTPPPALRDTSPAADGGGSAAILVEDLAGMRSQALGFAEAAALTTRIVPLLPRLPWWWMPGRFWPAPLHAARITTLPEHLAIGCGGKAAPVLAALRRRGHGVIQLQHPRIDPRRFDQVVVQRHDGLAGPNVVVTRTALHRVTQARLAEARDLWTPRFAHLPRPLLAVLLGGCNGRFRLEESEGDALAAQVAGVATRDRAGVMVTPSRRSSPAVVDALRAALEPLGGWVWDGTGDNPYFGMLACADAILVTSDSVSMVSEAAATAAPVLVAELPGRSRRIGAFLQGLEEDGRVRTFRGRLEMWHTTPLDDTQEAADTVRRRMGF